MYVKLSKSFLFMVFSFPTCIKYIWKTLIVSWWLLGEEILTFCIGENMTSTQGGWEPKNNLQIMYSPSIVVPVNCLSCPLPWLPFFIIIWTLPHYTDWKSVGFIFSAFSSQIWTKFYEAFLGHMKHISQFWS